MASAYTLTLRALSALGALLASLRPALADETPFASIYTTELLPKGAMESQQWVSWKHKKPQEQFDQVEGRTEFEYGVSNKFLASLYANYEHTKIGPNGPGAPDGAAEGMKNDASTAEFFYHALDASLKP